MKGISIKQLRIINFLSIAVAVALWLLFFFNFFSQHLFRDLRFFPYEPLMVSSPLFILCALIISIKNKQHKGTLLYALFISLLSQNYALQHLHMINYSWVPDLILIMSTAITGTVFIKSLQSFPRQLTNQDIKSVFPKNRLFYSYLRWSLKEYTWLLFPLLIGALGYAVPFKPLLIDPLIDMAILFTALTCLFVNYKKSSMTERNKILWLFWGMISYTFLTLIGAIIKGFDGETGLIVSFTLISLKAFLYTLSLIMSLFFFNTYDTGTIVRRSIVDGSIFTLIVLIYNTIEHYFLHWLSEKLHFSDVLISSFLSGIFVLIFSPLHHKLMHFLEKRVKKHPVNTTEAADGSV